LKTVPSLIAYELNCKGTTVYKDGCRDNQVISAAYKKRTLGPKKITPKPRPRKTKGETTKYTMGCGKLYVSVNKDDQGLCEVFANLGKAGGCQAQSEATCRTVSAALRSDVDPGILVEQLKGIRCLSTITRRKEQSDIDVLSCPDAIARAIEETLGNNHMSIEKVTGRKCPYCGQPLKYESGCDICKNCGYSNCG
jgi:ribonucleoside-diphosphate reductase alpha chain